MQGNADGDDDDDNDPNLSPESKAERERIRRQANNNRERYAIHTTLTNTKHTEHSPSSTSPVKSAQEMNTDSTIILMTHPIQCVKYSFVRRYYHNGPQ